jgi:hypothetical protein
MKERPILFSGEMVRAILEGRKNQTRRALKKQPLDILPMKVPGAWVTLRTRDPEPHGDLIGCRFGVPGDRLWVRETFVLEHCEDDPKVPADRPLFHYESTDPMNEYDNEYWMIPHYKATDPAPDLYYGDIDENDDGEPKCKWTPSIFMPRWASRISLEIVGVHIERLQVISEEDACSEGVEALHIIFDHGKSYRDTYMELWNQLNKKRGFGWDVNPWVWIIKFKLLKVGA